MQSLITFLEVVCNLHIESLMADFIKDYDYFTGQETWYFTGIIAYRLDSALMSQHSVNLYPFTLNPLDDLRYMQVTLPRGNTILD